MPAIKKAFDLMVDDRVKLSTENETLKIKNSSNGEEWLDESKAKLLKQIDEQKRAILIMSRMKKQMNEKYQMAFISCNKFSESDFDNIVSSKDRVKDVSIKQFKI